MQITPATPLPASHGAAHNLAALKRGTLQPAEQRAAVASQFEAILLRQFLQDSVGSMLGGDKGASGNVYGYMLTDSLADKLSEGKGMGLAPMLAKQLAPRTAPVARANPGTKLP